MLALIIAGDLSQHSPEHQHYALVEYDGTLSASGNILEFKVYKGRFYNRRVDAARIIKHSASEDTLDMINIELERARQEIKNIRANLANSLSHIIGE